MNMFIRSVGLRPQLPVTCLSRSFSLSPSTHDDGKSGKKSPDYKLLIIGSGTGGTAAANIFSFKFGAGKVAVLEDAKTHWYQPGFTMVGGGLHKMKNLRRETAKLLPRGAVLIEDSATQVMPDENAVLTKSGKRITYQYLIVAAGIQLRYDKIAGALEALDNYPEVVSNYAAKYVVKTFPSFENTPSGTAIFTFPAAPIKCAGAPQKICYMFDDYCRRTGKRDAFEILYNTSLPRMFGVVHYAGPLLELVKRRGITPNFKHNLVEVKPAEKTAIFDLLDENNKAIGRKEFKYDILHIAPPCSPQAFLREAHKNFVDDVGFVTVDKGTLQHVNYPNVFAVGDCNNAPTAKTAAAISSQTNVISQNLSALDANKPLKATYDGYTSCPLVTSNRTAILAEFDYSLQPLETTPMDQRKERWTSFYLKNTFMPQLYWYGLTQGLWRGPKWIRRLMHLGMKN